MVEGEVKYCENLGSCAIALLAINTATIEKAFKLSFSAIIHLFKKLICD
jgi:hypothetical protein